MIFCAASWAEQRAVESTSTKKPPLLAASVVTFDLQMTYSFLKLSLYDSRSRVSLSSLGSSLFPN